MPTSRAFALCLLLSTPAMADDIPGSDFTSGNWNGRAWQDNTGKFVDCYVGVSYVDGAKLTLSLAGDDTLTVFLSAPGVSFIPDKVYEASLMTEIGYPIHGRAYAPSADYIGFTIIGINDAMDYLTQGSYLRLLGVGLDQSLDVRGMGGALAQARACHMVYSGAGLTAAAGPAPATAPAADPAAPPKLGIKGSGAKPAQMSGDAATFKRQHMPCKDAGCR
jgi:hypothetical protein